MPSAISMVFCSSRSCGCTAISNCSVTRSSCASRRAIEIWWLGLPKIGSPIERQAWAKISSDWSGGT